LAAGSWRSFPDLLASNAKKTDQERDFPIKNGPNLTKNVPKTDRKRRKADRFFSGRNPTPAALSAEVVVNVSCPSSSCSAAIFPCLHPPRSAKLLHIHYNVCYNGNMTNKLKITTVGNSAGIVLPREILERLRVEKGDSLFVSETPNGIELTPFDEEFAEDMAVAEKVMRDNRDLLRKLAE
jgi:putative addiction module antidote